MNEFIFYMGCTSRSIWIQPIKKKNFYRLKRSLRRLCFYRCVSVHRGEWAGTLRDQVHPPGHVPNPRTRCTPQVYPPWAGTPPGTRYTRFWDQVHSPEQVHPLWDQVHPRDQVQTTPEQCILGDMGNKRAVCILLECILVENNLTKIHQCGIQILKDVDPRKITLKFRRHVLQNSLWWYVMWSQKGNSTPV